MDKILDHECSPPGGRSARPTLWWRLRTMATLASAVGVLATGCGGGAGAGSDIAAVGARQQTSASTCSAAQVVVSIQSVRIKTTGGGWLEFPLPAPQPFNLLGGSADLLQSLGLRPLPTGDYSEVRLVLASADGSSFVQDSSGATAALGIPSASASGLKIKGAFQIPPGQLGDLSVSPLDACALRPTGNGRYMLDPVLNVQVAVSTPPAAGPQVGLSTAGTLAALPWGGFLSVISDQTAGTWSAQRITAGGAPVGPLVVIPSPLPNIDSVSFIALQGGGYAAVWPGDQITFGRFGEETLAFMLQTYTDAGVPIGSPVQIGATQPFFRWIGAPIAFPVAAPLPSGGFAVVWVNSTTGGLSLFVQRFSASASAASAAQVVAPDVSGELGLGALSTGGYMVTWDGGARAYTASDAAVGRAQSVGPRWGGTGPAAFPGSSPEIAPLSSGGAVVVWTSLVAGTAKAQQLLLAPDATALMGPAVVDGSGPLDPPPLAPAAAGLTDGSYVITWIKAGAGGTSEVHAQRFAAAGTSIGPDTRIDLAGTNPANPAVTATSDGGFVIAWTATGADGVRRDYMRTFTSAGLLPV